MIKFNESNAFFYGKELINHLNDICLELKHYDIEYKILPELSNEISLKMLGLYLNGSCSLKTNFQITIKANETVELENDVFEMQVTGFDKSKKIVISVINQIESYMETEGFKCEFELQYQLKSRSQDGQFGLSIKKSKFDEGDFNPRQDRLAFTKNYKNNPCRGIKILFTK